MTRSQARQLLDDLKIRPSRKLGQNFLVDDNLRRCLVADAEVRDGELVVEIGPGLGAMTELLLIAGCRLIAIEYDVRLAEYMQERFGDSPRCKVIQGDASRTDYEALIGGVPWRCVANLPYAVSTVVLGRMLDIENPPTRLDLVIQKEMGERLIAQPRTKAYGSLSVRTQMQYQVKITRSISPPAFLPQPKVISAAISMIQRPDRPDSALWKVAANLVKVGFSQRRKKLINLLIRSGCDELVLNVSFEEMGLNKLARAEELTVAQFRELAERIRAGED